MSDIQKDLQLKKKSEINNFEGLKQVQELKLLQSSEDAQDLNIALKLGRNNSIVKALDEQGRLLDLKRLDEEFDGNVYDLDQIKNIAKKYNLVFRNSKHYCGNIEVE